MQPTRRNLPTVIVAFGLTVGLCVVNPVRATAAEMMPPLQYPAVGLSGYTEGPLPGSSGSVTLPCNSNGSGADLVTYSSSGAVVRQLDRTQYIDGVKNCIEKPVTDKTGVLYGTTYGQTPSGSWMRGQYLYAYTGSTLKWKYPLACGSQGAEYVVGANGTIYATAWLSDGMHLIGINPELTAGQIQPSKVLDVKVANDCSVDLFPHRDGLVLRGQSSGFQFFSYTGAPIAQPTVSQFWHAKLNAQGHFFDYQFVAGSYTSANIIKIDPVSNNPNDKSLWTTSVSTTGGNVQSVSVYPLTSGGAVALVREQKMVSPGVPETPTQYIENLVSISAAGLRGAVRELPKAASQGTFGASYISSTVDGMLTVVRDMRMNTGLSWPATVPAVVTGVYDPVAGAWSDERLIAGDISKIGGPYGYSYVSPGSLDGAITSTAGAIVLVVKCDGNCGTIKQKLLAVATPSGGADYPRSTVINASPRPVSAYIALGDSFSSGEGIPPFQAGTDTPGVNHCHRSNSAYPQLIAGTSPKIPSFGSGGFRACSGAISPNVGDGAPWNEGIQLDWWPDPTTQVVTLTLGGNDIGFGDFAKACALSTCDPATTAYGSSLNSINNALAGRLATAYRRVLQYAPNAKVFVIGYPQVIGHKSITDPDDFRCFYLQDGGSKWADARAARDIVTRLNQKISSVVTTVRGELPSNARLTYVPMDAAGSPFAGHEVCGTSTSWFQNVDQYLTNPSYVFHPNVAGQEGYAVVVGAAINAS